MIKNPQTRAYLALTFALLGFAGQVIVLKFIIDPTHGYTALPILFIRQVMCIFVLLPFAGMLIWRNRTVLWQHRGFLIKGGLLVFFFHAIAFNVGLQYSTALNAFIITSLLPVFATLMSMIVFRERVSLYTLFYIALGILGALITISKGDMTVFINLQVNIGDILIVISVLLWAIYGFMMKQKPPAVETSVFLFVGFILSSLAFIPVVGITHGFDLYKDVWTLDYIALVLYAVVIGQIVAVLAYSYSATILGGVIPTVGMNLLPLVGSLFAIVILDEVFHTYHAVALAIMGVSVYKIIKRDIRKNAPQKKQT